MDSSRKILPDSIISDLLFLRLNKIKELLHHSLASTPPFSIWLEEVATGEEREILQRFSENFCKHMFASDSQVPLEDDLVQSYGKINLLFRSLTEVRIKLYEHVGKPLFAYLAPFYPLITTEELLRESFGKNMNECEDVLFQALKFEIDILLPVNSVTDCLKISLTRLIYEQEMLYRIIFFNLRSGLDGGRAPMLADIEKIYSLLPRFKDNFQSMRNQLASLVDLENQIEINNQYMALHSASMVLEAETKIALNCLRKVLRMHEWKTALCALINDQNDNELKAFFRLNVNTIDNKEEYDLRVSVMHYLHGNINGLMTVHERFVRYLQKQNQTEIVAQQNDETLAMIPSYRKR